VKIDIIGSRGIPNNYGGFETFAERLSVALVGRGHKVTVYGQHDRRKKVFHECYEGVECFNLKAPARKAFQKPVLSLQSTFHSAKNRPDIVLFLGVSSAPFSFLGRLRGAKTVINLDGLEWKRAKWGKAGRTYLRISEWLSTKTCNAVVADSRALVDIYRELYSIDSVFIPYGADVPDSVPADALQDFGLEPGRYILQSCRLEPENNVDLVIEAYLKWKRVLPLVILGDAPMGDVYKEKLRNLAEGKVWFLGSVYGPAYNQIVAHSALYVHAHEVGGTNPSLLEAMAVGKAPLYLDVPFNREVAGEVGFPFQKDANALAALLGDLGQRLDEVNSRSEQAKQIIRERYSWDSVVDGYEKLFLELVGRRSI
jgi:glycosyltransferase involved in cell wall biosynthesis